MSDEYKPLIFKKHSLMSPAEREEESERTEAYAAKEGRSVSEVFRIAMMRMKFEEIHKGEFYDEKLVESRKNGEAHMDFIQRMKRTYLAH